MIEKLFDEARTHNRFLDRPIDDATLRRLYDHIRFGPTAANATPGRFVFVRSKEAKERLRPCLSAGNADKTMSAPVCVIVAWDTRFHDWMPKLFPSRDMKSVFEGKDALIEETAFRNSTLQGAYLIVGARAMGLAVGPMSGFDREKLDAEFFPDGRWTSNFLCNLGYGSEEELFPRNPRLDFDEACRIV
jgi:3-hydroxypropanoate dehydrogenase